MLVLYETPAGYALFKVMDEKKMKEVGVTAGVLKVIAAVEGATGGASAAAKQKGTKRAAVEDGKQPKLSKFFGKK